MTDKQKLKPCPFCGNTDLFYGECSVNCKKCETEGPYAEQEKDMRILWNLRKKVIRK